jgi:hypothetical protein
LRGEVARCVALGVDGGTRNIYLIVNSLELIHRPLAAVDAWIAKQKEPDLSRPEAIRRLVELGLKAKGK